MKKIIALVLILVISVSLVSCFEEKPYDFSAEGMTITLTSSFSKLDYEGFTACYISPTVAVFTLKEPFSLSADFGDLTLSEYADLVHSVNAERNPTEIINEDGLTYMEYVFYNEQEDMTYKYFSAMFKASDAFWLIQFSTVKDFYDEKKPQFIEWAQGVKFE